MLQALHYLICEDKKSSYTIAFLSETAEVFLEGRNSYMLSSRHGYLYVLIMENSV